MACIEAPSSVMFSVNHDNYWFVPLAIMVIRVQWNHSLPITNPMWKQAKKNRTGFGHSLGISATTMPSLVSPGDGNVVLQEPITPKGRSVKLVYVC